MPPTCVEAQRAFSAYEPPTEIEFGALSLQNMLSGGSSFNDFHEKQLTKVQLFKVVSHDNHKFVQFKQY